MRAWLLLMGAMGLAVWAGYLLLTGDFDGVDGADGARPEGVLRDSRDAPGESANRSKTPPSDHIGQDSRDALREILRDSDEADEASRESAHSSASDRTGTAQ